MVPNLRNGRKAVVHIIVNWKFIFTIIAIILLLICGFMYKKGLFNKRDTFDSVVINETITELYDHSNAKCICAFDIDHTINCGNPKPFIDMCKMYGCKLALNTARPIKYVDDVDLESINFTKPHFDDSDFYYNQNSYSQTPEHVAEVKATFLNLLNDKYDINNKECVILLDDNKNNIRVAKDKGFGTVKAKATRNSDCGLSNIDLIEFENILRICNTN